MFVFIYFFKKKRKSERKVKEKEKKWLVKNKINKLTRIPRKVSSVTHDCELRCSLVYIFL
jgi:hypothetical protein